jgi:uncharacterized membrane protein required for colicin V production
MEIEEFINSFRLFDLLVLLALGAMFILGYIQGVIRRLIGIVSVSFSFVLAAHTREPFGNFLASNWTQWPADYSRMIGFGLVFVTLGILLALIAQLNYKPVMLWPKYPFLEEVIGGLLGIVQGLLILLYAIVIIDPFFRATAGATVADELPFLRSLHDAFDPSATAAIYRATVIPGFLALFGWLLPEAVKAGLEGRQ